MTVELEKIMEFLQNLSGTETVATVTQEEVNRAEQQPNNETNTVATDPGANTGNTDKSFEVSEVEPTQVEAPAPDKDVTIVTPNNIVEESIDMRLAGFYDKQKELESAVQNILAEIAQIKKHFQVLENTVEETTLVDTNIKSMVDLVRSI